MNVLPHSWKTQIPLAQGDCIYIASSMYVCPWHCETSCIKQCPSPVPQGTAFSWKMEGVLESQKLRPSCGIVWLSLPKVIYVGSLCNCVWRTFLMIVYVPSFPCATQADSNARIRGCWEGFVCGIEHKKCLLPVVTSTATSPPLPCHFGWAWLRRSSDGTFPMTDWGISGFWWVSKSEKGLCNWISSMHEHSFAIPKLHWAEFLDQLWDLSVQMGHLLFLLLKTHSKRKHGLFWLSSI